MGASIRDGHYGYHPKVQSPPKHSHYTTIKKLEKLKLSQPEVQKLTSNYNDDK